jgi:molybdopterin molybdotransferase
MPAGADGEGPDTVMMQEDCEELGAAGARQVRIPPGIKRGSNRRKRGEDVRAGSVILKRGQRLRPQDIGLAASIGCTALEVRTPLRVAVFSTGDEIREPGSALPPGCVYDANRFTLAALLAQLGCSVTDLGVLPDRVDAIKHALARAALDHGLIITSGGVSTGDEDHVKAAVEALGTIHAWRLAIKPGRPIALGQVGRVPFLGLPGNPVAVMVTFLRIARPMILKLMGGTDTAPHLYRVRAAFEHKKKKDRREWVRARLAVDADGTTIAEKFPRQGAGVLTSMVESDGLVELPESMTRLVPGTMVDFLPFSEVS